MRHSTVFAEFALASEEEGANLGARRAAGTGGSGGLGVPVAAAVTDCATSLLEQFARLV